MDEVRRNHAPASNDPVSNAARMTVTMTEDAAVFAERARDLFARDPIGTNVIAGQMDSVMHGRARYPGALWLTVDDDSGTPLALAMHTPPFNLFLGPLPAGASRAGAEAAARALIELLASLDRTVPGVTGPPLEAEAVVRGYTARHGLTARCSVAEGVFELTGPTALRPPEGLAGAARAATEADVDLLIAWLAAFRAEAVPEDPVVDLRPRATALVGTGSAVLWQDGGRPVSLAGSHLPTAGVSRIGPVYTPPEHRRHGYAAGVTAAASELGFRRGARHCMLYTDLANPTSNALYQRLGYRRVGDAVQYRFEPGSDPGRPASGQEAARGATAPQPAAREESARGVSAPAVTG